MSAVIAGRYRLEQKLASGGMGEVWIARDETLGRRVAVKLLRDALAEDPIVAERFKREALTAASLSHPNMADVYDYVEENGRPGIVMELVDGETLARRLTRGRIEIADAVRIGTEVAAALEAAHEAGIIHRDVKPGNIMVTPRGGVKVTDFGIARASGDATLTETGTVMGTAHYAAPEQVQGRGATPSSDVYSLGIVLYESLTGHRPFEAETPVAAALARLTKDPSRPRRYRREIPAALEAVIMRSLAREPVDRYSSAAEMGRALQEAMSAADTEALPTGILPTAATAAGSETAVLPAADSTVALPRGGEPPKPPRMLRPRRLQIVVVAVLVALAGLVFGFALRGSSSVEIPALVNKPVSIAIQRTVALGLRFSLEEASSRAPVGIVVAQTPKAGTILEKGARISFVISKGPPGTPCCAVPKLIGLSRTDAEELLRRTGLQVGEVTSETRSGVPAGTVIAQSPEAGKIVDPGSKVDIVISRSRKGKGRDNND